MHNPILTVKVKRIEKNKLKQLHLVGESGCQPLKNKKKKKKEVKIVVDKSHINQSIIP